MRALWVTYANLLVLGNIEASFLVACNSEGDLYYSVFFCCIELKEKFRILISREGINIMF